MSQTNTATNIAVLKHKDADEKHVARSLWGDAIVHLLHDKLTILAFIVLALLTLISVLGPPYVENALGLDVTRIKVLDRFKPPGTEGHLLGTDEYGRDQLIRLMYGGRISLAIAYTSSVMILAIGVTLGLAAGYYGGIVDDIIMWSINTLSSMPPLFILLVVSALWSPVPEMLVIILALLGWFGTCRLVRGEVLSIKERDYVLAARALGASNMRLLFVHIFPNVLSIVIVTGTIIAGNLILLESSLSFLGLGVQPPSPTWGNMLTNARNFLVTGFHLIVWPGILIMITVLCFYLIGDGLRDALDPRRKHGVK
ncbi:MAG: ABC transporter permease [Anaerolineae bacterium]|nr:ABC transporter permease [Anaerolineae bacterium]MDQ7035936.1 ABC transporter permease [Anaerolineae bacterium]